jgi:hypothetical protein
VLYTQCVCDTQLLSIRREKYLKGRTQSTRPYEMLRAARQSHNGTVNINDACDRISLALLINAKHIEVGECKACCSNLPLQVNPASVYLGSAASGLTGICPTALPPPRGTSWSGDCHASGGLARRLKGLAVLFSSRLMPLCSRVSLPHLSEVTPLNGSLQISPCHASHYRQAQ